MRVSKTFMKTTALGVEDRVPHTHGCGLCEGAMTQEKQTSVETCRLCQARGMETSFDCTCAKDGKTFGVNSRMISATTSSWL